MSERTLLSRLPRRGAAGVALALARNKSGRRVLRRIYRFEFSETGNTRLEGQLILLGDTVESVTMEPYKMLHEDQ